MKKAALFIALSSACITPLFAQEEVATGMHEKKLEHQVGVQANELIRQVFNFNNANTATTNPYLLIYSLNFRKSGWGVRTGVGYTKRTITVENNTGTLETNIDEVKSRLGFEKAFRLPGRWTAGAGLDVLYNNANNKTVNTITGFDSSSVTTKSLVSSYGGGPMAWLRYNISERVLIGTETSIYYTTGFEKKTIEIKRTGVTPGPFPTTQPAISISNTDDKLSNVGINLPVAIYLIVKF